MKKKTNENDLVKNVRLSEILLIENDSENAFYILFSSINYVTKIRSALSFSRQKKY